MAKGYPAEIYEFVKANVEKYSNSELAEITNHMFGTNFTKSKMKSYIGNHGLYRKNYDHNGWKGKYSEVFPEEIFEYICSHYIGCGPKEMTARLNEKFHKDYKVSQLNAFYKNHGLNSGLTGQFQKGMPSHNKGKKMSPDQYEKCKGTMFKKGNVPHNHMEVGEYSHTSEGYLIRKVSEIGSQRERFEFVHRAVWEEHNGLIPEGSMVIFLDGNKDNCNIDNLALVDLKENAILNHQKLRFEDAELTKTGIAIAKLKIARKRRLKND